MKEKIITALEFLRSEKSFIFNLSSQELMIIYMLASHTGKNELCCISISDLSKVCRLSRTSVIRYLKSLESKKLISKQTMKGCNNIYKLNISNYV